MPKHSTVSDAANGAETPAAVIADGYDDMAQFDRADADTTLEAGARSPGMLSEYVQNDMNAAPPAPSGANEFTTGQEVARTGPRQLRRARRVSLPVLPFKAGMTITVKIVDAFREGKPIANSTITTPARLCTIEGMRGSMATLIANKVLEKELSEAYPDNGYIGKWFEITRLPPREGKRYATFVITELEE